MRIGRVLAVAGFSWFGGIGGGLALLGEWQRALAWLATFPLVALLGVLVSPWCLMLLFVLMLGAMVHAIVRAVRTDAPLRLLGPWPITVFIASIGMSLVLRATIVEAFKIPSSSMEPTLDIGDHVFVDKLTPHWRAIERGEVVVYVYPCDPRRDYIHRVVALAGDTVEVRCNVLYVNGKAVPDERAAGACSYQDYDENNDTWFAKECSRYHETLGSRAWDVFYDAERPARDAAPHDRGDARDFPMPEHAPSCSYEYTEREIHDQVAGKIVETKADAAPCEPQLHYVVPPDHVFVMGDNRYNANDSRIFGAVPAANVEGRLLGIWWSRSLGRIGTVR